MRRLLIIGLLLAGMVELALSQAADTVRIGRQGSARGVWKVFLSADGDTLYGRDKDNNTYAISPGGSGSSAFSAITTGTNLVATMTVGDGASFGFSGEGIVDASRYRGTSIVTGGEFAALSGLYITAPYTTLQSQLNKKLGISAAIAANKLIKSNSILQSPNEAMGIASSVEDAGDGYLTFSISGTPPILRIVEVTGIDTVYLAMDGAGAGYLRDGGGVITFQEIRSLIAGSGITSLGGQTGAVQTFATGTTGTDFGISSATNIHRFNLPVASGTNTGKLSNTDWTAFDAKVDFSDTTAILAYIKYLNSLKLALADVGDSIDAHILAQALVRDTSNANGGKSFGGIVAAGKKPFVRWSPTADTLFADTVGTLADITPGTGVSTALTVNVGSAGAFVVNGGALGTPSSGSAANLTSFPTLNQNTTGYAGGISIASQALGDLFYATSSTALGRIPNGTGWLHLASPSTFAWSTPTAADVGAQASDVDLSTLASPTAWRVFYSNGSSAITELALGASGTYLKSNGATAAPTFEAPAGSGDITSVGDVADGAAFDGTQGTTLTFNNAGGDMTQAYDGTIMSFSKPLSIGNGATGPGYIDLKEDTDNGTNRIRIIAPAAVTADVNLTAPDAAGTIARTEDLLTTSNPAAGRIPFFSSTTATDATDNLFWDNTTNASFLRLGSGTGAGELRLLEGSGGGTNYTSFKSPATLAANVAYVLPPDDGDAGEQLQTDGNGTLTWEAAGGGTGAPTDATYITQTANGTLSAEQALGTLATGMLASTTTTGVVASRVLTGTAGAITISNGDGSANPTFTLPSAITVPTSYAIGSDPADAGVLRLENAAIIGWEASPAGTDVTLTVDASEIMQASGAFNATALTEGGSAVPSATDNLGFFASTTSAQLAGVLSNETGSGVAVFGTTPTFTTSIIYPNSATDATLGTAGESALNTTDEQLSFHSAADGEISGEVAISLLLTKPITFDPKTVCDGAVDRLFLMWVGDEAPEGIIIDEWKISFEADPTTELDADLVYADAMIGVANPVVIDALDTTTGTATEDTDANINAGNAIPNGKVMYIAINTAYTEANHQVMFQIWYHYVES